MKKLPSLFGRSLHALHMILQLAGLGDGVFQQVSLLVFLFKARLFHPSRITSKTFMLRVGGVPVRVAVRNNFADPYVLHEVFFGHDYDLGLPAEPPHIIFDIGANVGYISLYFKTKYPDAKIFCFEPDPETFSQLVSNTKSFSDITCFPWALGARNETRTFYRSKAFHMRNSLIPQDNMGESFDVKTVTLQEAMNAAGVAEIDLMKFDIEGAEYELFKDPSPLEHIKTIMGEIHPYAWKGREEKEILETLNTWYVLRSHADQRKAYIVEGSRR